MSAVCRYEPSHHRQSGQSPRHGRRPDAGQCVFGAGGGFWARGYFVSTVGCDETVIREYIRQQEDADHRLDQLNRWRQ